MTEASQGGAQASLLRRALLGLEQAEARIGELERAARAPVAVIGVACRVPGADDPAAFWRLLTEGRDAVGPVPPGRWDAAAYQTDDPETPGRIAARAAGFLQGPVDRFDAGFFGIAPREAQGMDPQQRLLLEVSWEALEHAGQAPERLERSPTGVYVGLCASDYANLALKTHDLALLDAHFTSGIAHSIASGRLSYLLGLQGPSITIDTACSSSLVAVHLACQALRSGDCRMALAGGVNLLLAPELYIALSRARMLARDGRCKTFDAAADGFGRGEGCGMVVLKRLSDAQADGDRILAVIRGSAVNQDGPSGSLTAPNGPAQEAVIKEALARSGVEPRLVGYLEAHGTGTELGDPLEVQALGNVFGPGRPANQPLLLGSVKTNIGHLEGAAGVVGLIKLVLSLVHRQIPEHLHFRTPSPHIPWADLPFRVPTALTAWDPIEGRRLGGVSSFGFSGTNAHLVVEEAPAATPKAGTATATPRLLALSARDEKALAALAARHAEAVRENPQLPLEDVCFTANAGRSHFACRATVQARSLEELGPRLTALAALESSEGVARVRAVPRDPPRVAFLFTGQGAQYAGMARSLHETSPVFREAFDRVAELLAPHLDRPLRELVFPEPGASTPIDQTRYSQPALFAVEYALAELLRSWGVVPDMVIGHSIGEYAAACVAGMLDLPSAAALVAERGRLMQSLPEGGGMAAVFATEERVARALVGREARVSIAAVNGPEQTVISGALGELESLCAILRDEGIRCQPLPVSHAFHSPLVEPILGAFGAAAAKVRFGAPRLPFVSNVTGGVLTAARATDPTYFRDHVRAPVRFGAGLKALLALRPGVAIELGPHPTLLSFARATYGESGPLLLPSLHKQRPDAEQMLALASALYLAGLKLDFRALAAGTGNVVDLPTYPFQRERYWFQADARAARATPNVASGDHPLLGRKLRTSGSETIFEAELGADSPRFVRHHQVQGQVILPATAYLDGLLTLARRLLDPARAAVTDVSIEEAMLLAADGAPRTVQYVCEPARDGTVEVSITSAPAGDETASFERHVVATLSERAHVPARSSLAEARARCGRGVTAEEHYRSFVARGLDFGEDFHVVRELWCGDDESLGLVELGASSAAAASSYAMHPLLLDGCLQVLAAALAKEPGDALFLPIGIGAYRLLAAPGTRCWSHARVEPGSGETRRAELTIYAESGALLAELSGVRLKRVSRDALARNAERWLDDILYELVWREAEPATASVFGPELDVGSVVNEAARALPELRKTAELDAYDAFLPRFEALCAGYVLVAMQRLGWSPAPGDTARPAELAARLGVLPRHGRLFARLLAILAETGVLERSADGFRVVRPLAAEDPERELSALARDFSCGAIELEVTAATAREMAESLRGDVDPMNLLFPGGSTARAERLYRDTPTARLYNGLLAELVTALSGRASKGRPLRILEIGAGTGGSTAHVLPRLPEGVEYTFTDVGPLFVARARERFGARPGTRFAVFDLEREPEAQGFMPGSFDCVIASNVIHATSRLGVTLERVRALLAPGGVLAMLEVTAPQRWFDLTVGFTEGWWAFADTDLRTDYATLTRARWFEVLRTAGFDAVGALPADGAAVGTLSLQSLFLARASGKHAAAREWLLFADAGGVASALARHLAERGDRCLLVEPGAFAFDGTRATLDGASAADYRQLLAALRESGRVPRAVIDARGDTLKALLLAQALVGEAPPRLVFLTSGAQQVMPKERAVDPHQGALWGLARTLRREHPELGCVCVDLAPGEAAPVTELTAELDAPGREVEISWHARTRRVERLVRYSTTRRRGLGTGPRNEPYRLVPAVKGSLEGFTLAPVERRAPGPGEVEIEVEATGLNFKDVLNVLGMYPGEPGPLGGECSGTVAAVGEGVQRFKPGDAVMAVAPGCFASHVVARVENVQPRLPGMSAEEAAAFPIAFLTAAFCLDHLARVRQGDRVLIHAAAGGVGMAAVHVARRAGAEVFATAGSPWKRELVKSLGATHVFDSRSDEFAREIAALTQGRGVDVVLNSLTGPLIDASFAALAPNGRFVEIGKRGIKDAAWVAALGRNIAYHVVDWGETSEHEPALIGALFEGLVRDLESGRLTSLPRHAFALDDAAEAFRLMAQAGHAGKIVVRHGAPERHVRADGTYVVTGGLSGLGLVVARWLVEHAAGRVVLLGRRPVDARVEAELAPLRRPTTTLVAESLDVTDEQALRGLFERLRREGPPLRGVVHGAGVLDDASFMQQTPARLERVLAPKVRGAELLDSLTRADPLDWFVLFSSGAGVLGSPGQANHAAANAFLGGFARARQAKGLHALCIDWGAWTEVGAAVERGVMDRLAAKGLGAITPAQGLTVLERLLASEATQVAVVPADWQRYVEQAGGAVPPFLRELVNETSTESTSTSRAEVARPADVRAELAALPEGRRRPRLSAFVRERALKALGLSASFELDPTTPLGELGLDSLLAVELRNNLATALSRPMPPTLLFDYPTLETLTDYLFEHALELAPKPAAVEEAPRQNLVESIEDLSDEEVERQLAALKQKR
ncbi:MAG TPA: SDR family NAD(P)-dependent oxidoreductase [Polyangiaceae bacterium]|nr:SDR family NAD(P)-dependent oxidoreductase [Polyangiaceae bacterium]